MMQTETTRTQDVADWIVKAVAEWRDAHDDNRERLEAVIDRHWRAQQKGGLWFCNDGESFKFHETRESAEQAAEDAIDVARDFCDPVWPDWAERICWGEVKGVSVQKVSGETESCINVEYTIEAPQKGGE